MAQALRAEALIAQAERNAVDLASISQRKNAANTLERAINYRNYARSYADEAVYHAEVAAEYSSDATGALRNARMKQSFYLDNVDSSAEGYATTYAAFAAAVDRAEITAANTAAASTRDRATASVERATAAVNAVP
mmetsp:Transcript_48861/g.54654  ORF Transcript_48861/g.54654 Transcript_48861/m.54654 type:complete len:136 (-) Transcript_48861:393-800(-)